ncbi:MAG TPA: hypothetical protein VFJ02_12860 [Vicinamibacterales bacterium]|nr:hypothetical protein [Vicinamibacterales bacterium]
MTSLVLLLSIALAGPLAAEDTTLGKGVTLTSATAITAVAERPADYVGKTLRVDGVATAVCTHMGCWMAVAPEGDASGPTIRLKVEDGVIVFPVTAKGKRVSAEGVFEAVGANAEASEAAGEHAKVDPKASAQYQLKATGAIIRER